jgi:hypothetical protein
VADRGSRALRRRVFTTCDVDGIVSFENRRAIFPIHRSVRFVLLTATRGRATSALPCRFGEDDPTIVEALRHGPDLFPVTIPMPLLELMSPEDLSVPDLRSTLDLGILERAIRLFPPLGSRGGWHARFGRELNATDDRDALRPPGAGLPVLEGKHIEPFRVAVGDARYSIAEADARARLPGGAFRHRRLAYRDVAGAANRTTFIAAILPENSVSTHTLFCLKTRLDAAAQQFLCGLFNTFVVNYLVRLRVGTHVTTAIVERLPIPTAAHAGAALDEIAGCCRILTSRFELAVFAQLNAVAARLYQLSAEEFTHIVNTFPLVEVERRQAAISAYWGR